MGRNGLPETIVARRCWIALAWIALIAALTPQAWRLGERLNVAETGGTGEAASVERALASRFGSPYVSVALLVVAGIPANAAAGDEGGGSALRDEVADVVRALPFVRQADWIPTGDSHASHAGRPAVLAVGLDPESAAGEDAILRLREATSELALTLAARHPEVELAWTGAPAINYDVRLTSASDAAAAERRALPPTLLLLFIVFGSVVAALLPLTVAALAIVLALGAASLVAAFWPLTVLLRNIVSMLGLAVGIDYALLTVSRFREALRDDPDPRRAAVTSLRHAGHTVLLSGAAVAIGFAALLVVPATELRSIALGGLFVTLAAVLLATTLLPGLLAWIGRGIDLGRVRRRTAAARSGELWRRWGNRVARYPVLVFVAGATPMLALAWQARRASTDIPSGTWLPAGVESTRATELLIASGMTGVLQTIRVLVELPDASPATSEAGWRAILRLGQALASDGRVARVRSLPTLLGPESPDPLLFSLIPPRVRTQYVSRDEKLALIELVPGEATAPAALTHLVRELRGLDASSIAGLPGVTVSVGGLPAANADYQDAIGGSVWMAIAVLLGGTFFALLVGFRSILVPLKAVVLNLISVAAAFGVAVLVFQDGFGAGALGLAAPIDGLFPAVPIIVFCVVFGLSMDYEVFLVARVSESARRGVPDAVAIGDGLAGTGRVITSAALVMIVVFASFAFGEFLIVKILGFTLGVAVLLDATLVRVVMGPALLRLAGRWNWWPGPEILAPSARGGQRRAS